MMCLIHTASPSKQHACARLLTLAQALLLGMWCLFTSGCASPPGEMEQQQLLKLYESGQLAEAAELSMQYSEEVKESTSRNALLWHLEAGSVNLDARNGEAARIALERAEKLLYLYDGQSAPRRFFAPGRSMRYNGARSDRLMLHMLKGFYYLSQGDLENMLVEMRILRFDQFRYVLDEADPEMRQYDLAHTAQAVAPYGMKNLLAEKGQNGLFQKLPLEGDYREFRERKRPELSLMFHPLAFYSSAMGYYFDNEWDEAVIDLKYLRMLDPNNQLYQRDLVTLLTMQHDPIPDDLKHVQPWEHALGDQVVYVIFSEGTPLPWRNVTSSFTLPDMVPATWNFCVPDKAATPARERVQSTVDGITYQSSFLADLSEIQREEYWQKDFPDMSRKTYQNIVATTAANRSAKASLVAAQAIKDPEQRLIATAAAASAVAATSRVDLNNQEWRRWSTIARSYSIMHFPLPSNRQCTLEIDSANGARKHTLNLTFSEETNHAIVFVRKINPSNYLCQNWESME